MEPDIQLQYQIPCLMSKRIPHVVTVQVYVPGTVPMFDSYSNTVFPNRQVRQRHLVAYKTFEPVLSRINFTIDCTTWCILI